jgi:hypothetical protein
MGFIPFIIYSQYKESTEKPEEGLRRGQGLSLQCKGGTAILFAESFGRFGTINVGVVNIRREQVLA